MKTRRRTLNREITIATMAASIGALVLFGTVMMILFFISFLGSSREDLERLIENVGQQFEDKMQFIQDGTVMIRHNEVLGDFFELQSVDTEEMEKQLSYSMELFSERNMADQQTPFVTSLCVFNQKEAYIKEHYYPMTVAAADSKEQSYLKIQQEFRESDAQYGMTVNADEMNLCYRLYDDEMQEMGICVAGINQEAVSLLFSSLDEYGQAGWAVFSGEDLLLYSSGAEALAAELADLENNFSGICEIGNNRSLCLTKDCGFGVSIVLYVGMSNMYTILKPTMLTFLVVVFLAIAFIAIVMLGVSYRLTKPLKTLSANLKAFGKKDLQVRMEDSPITEIHEISQMFNEMAERMQYLIEQIYEKQLLAARAQTKYLQSQINPHFQFNILAMFSIRAKLAGDEELYRGLQAFSRLMQGKIFREKEILIPVSEEMELVSFYLYLQKSRFGDALSYEIEYGSEEIKEMRIPRLLIENLVENAVSHGLEPKNGRGFLKVSLTDAEERLTIVVEDDGVGLDTEELHLLEHPLEPEDVVHTHTGLANMNRLLQIMYGDRFHMDIQGEKGKGTRVEIVLPAERRGENCGV